MSRLRRIDTAIDGLFVLETPSFGDDRGYFMETYNAREFEALGLPAAFAQDNFSRSRRGTLRGLHLQNPNPQGKLVRCTLGEVFDVAVDLRPGSPTLGRHHAETLSEDNRRALYVPEGLAHGFLVTSEVAHFTYKCTSLYAPADELGVRWDDPDLAIPWPVAHDAPPRLSEKDGRLPTLAALLESGRLRGP